MLTIKVPASSGNVGVGFDTLGLALNLYNTFTFETSDDFLVSGFEDAYNNSDNIVLKAYKTFAHTYAKTVKPVTITSVKNDIPISRGLGSSGTCLLAGVVAANEIHHLGQSLADCAAFAADMEGHADNVFASAFGRLTVSLKADDNYYYDHYPVHQDLKFYVLIPGQGLSTEALRDMLPDNVSLNDAVFNLSRMGLVTKAFETGNFKRLKVLLKDTLHEPYRYHTIPHKTMIEQLKTEQGAIALISGSGPTMLCICDQPLTLKKLPKGVTFKEVNVSEGIEVKPS